MNVPLTGLRRNLSQMEEYLRVSGMLVKVLIAHERPSQVVEERVSYGRNPQQYAVLHACPDARGQKKPLVFFLHGGGWGRGNAGMFRFIGRFFAEAGYPAILGGYRLAPRYKFPCQLEDAYQGLQAGIRLAEQYGLDTRSIIVAGQSAGAQLASLMTLDRDNLRRHGLQPQRVKGLLLISGLLNFAYCTNWKDRDMLSKYLGRKSDWERANPINYIRGDETMPILCIHGERDLLVDKQNSISFIEKLERTGVLYLSEKAYHTDLTSMFLEDRVSTKVLLRWLERVVERSDSDRVLYP